MHFSLLLLLTLLTQVFSQSISPTNCSCIAFRLDDIQDYWLSGVQRTIMDLFKELEVPLTIGIIANQFGEDVTLVNNIKTGLQDQSWDMEVCSHGYDHEDFSTFSLNEQINLLSESKQKIQQVLAPDLPPNSVVSFIPPFNAFNGDTITALNNQNIHYMSSQIEIDTQAPYPLFGQNLFRFPIGAATSDLEVEPWFVGIPHQATWQQIRTQLSTSGYSVIMMHPQEFASFTGDGYVDTLNATMINELRALLTVAKQSGLRLVPIRGVNVDDYINGASTTESTPVTTGEPPVITTGQAVVTTGTPIVTTGQMSVTTGQPPITTGSVQTTTGNTVVTTGMASTTGNEPATTDSTFGTKEDPGVTTGVELNEKLNNASVTEMSCYLLFVAVAVLLA